MTSAVPTISAACASAFSTAARFGLRPLRIGPVTADEFERRRQDEDNPVELIGGWILPMAPGGTDTGEMWCDLASILRAVVKRRGWRISLDARHRLPHPKNTVVFPDIAIHAAREIECRPGTHTAVRVPDLVVEILSDETYERDMAPTGAKYLAYEASGVKEYYYTRPDGRDAAGFGLIDGRYQPLPQRQGGWFASPLLGRDFRLVPAATRKRRATKRRR